IFVSFDPDVVQTHFGDAWLFPYLLELSQKTGIPFNPNRDLSLPVLRRKEVDFFNYGRAHYRAPQVHLRGRWHVDVENCMTYNQYQLIGAIEQTRLSNLPLQEVTRRSPGAAMAAMQVLTAMKNDTLIPYQHQKGEIPKTYKQFIRADRGGLIIQPRPGVFQNVAILDFSSMMPSLMIKYNISPETVVSMETEGEGFEIPELGVKVLSGPGLIPQTIKPMRDKRLALKQLLKTVDKNDPRYRGLRRQYKVVSKSFERKAVADAMKWLGVVCYGRLGFANATFGRINSHEVVSYVSRKTVTKAKLIAEEMGFDVLHVYVDSLMLTRAGASQEDYLALANEIKRETQLPIDLENTYSWFAFLSSRENPNISVANRFYGIAANGEHKIRGIALRRGDTPRFVADTQRQVIEILSKEADPAKVLNRLPEALEFVQTKMEALKKRVVPLDQLVVTQILSRDLDRFSVLSPVAVAARQLQIAGKEPKRGQRIRFVYIAPGPGVHAWDLGTGSDSRIIDMLKYKELTFRAVYEIIQPFGITERVARNWIFDKASYVAPGELIAPARRLAKQELPILADLPFLRVDTF
ncbi:MAG: DNA polymerase domain-containing protein, partial [Anaerolineales bacterium]